MTNKLQNKIGFGIGFADTRFANKQNNHQRFDEEPQQKSQNTSSTLEDKKSQFKKMSFVKSSD